MGKMLLLSLFLCTVLFTAPSISFAKYDMPVVTGEHWNHSTEQEKNAFLLGMGTIIKLEHEIQGNADIPDDKSLIDSWCEGLREMTLTDVRNAIDAYYAAHKDKLDRPVVEVMFVDIALPNVESKK